MLAGCGRIGQSVRVSFWDEDRPPRPRADYAGRKSANGFAWTESKCPGCCCRVRLRGTPSLRLEWEPLADGRYEGYVVHPVLADFTYEIEYESDSGIASGTGGGNVVDFATLPSDHQALMQSFLSERQEDRSAWHTCEADQSGGTGGTREPRRPRDPSPERRAAVADK